jgi:hypothetical protein
VYVCVGVFVRVEVEVRVGVGVGVKVDDGCSVPVGVDVAVPVGVFVGVSVGVGVGVAVSVGVGVGVDVSAPSAIAVLVSRGIVVADGWPPNMANEPAMQMTQAKAATMRPSKVRQPGLFGRLFVSWSSIMSSFNDSLEGKCALLHPPPHTHAAMPKPGSW